MSSGDRITVLITDDHQIFREGLVSIIQDTEDIEVCAEAGSAEDAIALVRDKMPDVVLMDINLPGMNGIDATLSITTAIPSTKVIILTVTSNDDCLFDAIRAGASGYLIKSASPSEVRDAIRDVFHGGVVVCPELAASLVDEFKNLEEKVGAENNGDGFHTLSEREKEVLRLLAEGKSNKEIAGELFLSERTVKNHISNVLAKLQLDNRIKAAVYAVKQGLTD